MRHIIGLLFLFSIGACGDRTQTTNAAPANTSDKVTDTTNQQHSPTLFNQYGFDTTYEISKKHHPFMVKGYFNPDHILDTAILVRRTSIGKDALFIKHGRTDKSYLIKNGKDLGTDFPDFNWVGQFEVVRKGTKIWNNVVDVKL